MLYTYIWYFIIYAFLGWCTEVVYATSKTGKFVNRGFLNGPVCPIYGFGVLLVLLLLTPLKKNIFLLFAGSVILTTVLEGITGFLLEKLFHTSWWDYSNEPFNLKGYICLRFSLIWGLACVLVVDNVHPLIAHSVKILPTTLGFIMLCVIIPLFIADEFYTVSVILKFNKRLEKLGQLNGRIRALSDDLGYRISETTVDAIELGDEAKKFVDSKKAEIKEDLLEDLSEFKDDLNRYVEEKGGTGGDRARRIEALKDEYFEALKMRRSDIRLLRAFPGAKSTLYSDLIDTIRNDFRELKERENKK